MDTYYFYTEGLTVGYHGVPLIKDIRISLKKGEILTLIGPNGAGKTTILKSIIRQLAPLGGVAVLDGKAMGDLSGKELSQKLSVVLTERIHPEMMTCRDVVSTGRYPYTGKFGVLSGEDWAVVDEAMDLVHIHELADRDYTKTSDGQKQRVMLARALCQQPDIIVLDEPTSFLDIRYKLEFLSFKINVTSAMPSSISSVTPSSARCSTTPISRIQSSIAERPACATCSAALPSALIFQTFTAKRLNFGMA